MDPTPDKTLLRNLQVDYAGLEAENERLRAELDKEQNGVERTAERASLKILTHDDERLRAEVEGLRRYKQAMEEGIG